MRLSLLFGTLLLSAVCLAQQDAPKQDRPRQDAPSQKDASKPANPDDQESSSRDTRIDTTAPKDDAKNHPNSADAVSGLDAPPPSDGSDVQEFHPWNPYKANKDVQVGDYYYKRKNYKGALDRYKEALYYKPNDAVATFRLAQCQEKLGNKEEARKNFEQYLKILPDGPLAKEAHNSLAKLDNTH